MGERYTNFTTKKRADFLAVLAAGGTVTSASRAIGMSRRNAYFVRDAEPEFAAAWDDAYLEGSETLVGVAVARATEKSDVLLMFVIKQRLPEFRDSVNLKHTGDADAPVVVEQRANPTAVRAAEDAYIAANPAEPPRD